MVDRPLRREVIAPDGPDRRDAVASHRRRRKAVERGRRFLSELQVVIDEAGEVHPCDVADELRRLIRALEETL